MRHRRWSYLRLNNSPEPSEIVARCPGCGALVRPNRVEGLCPACVWKSITAAPFEDGSSAPAMEVQTGLFPLPNHVVVEEIARGGMGIVYRARQLDPPRAVAVKMLLPHQAGSVEMLERFHLEVRAVAALEHPGILPIYAVGEHEGIPYFTMKLATQGTLASRLSHFRAQFREIGELMAGLTDAVHFAHERGVLHRDLKPGNILFDDQSRAYVADFGLAKFTQFSEGDTSALTRSIQLLGTPQFLPPEVASGGVARATTAGDVYSLGAILYELLTGQPPFSAPGLTALLKRISEEEPIRPSKLFAPVPHDLEVVCLKCLAKDPAQRYGSARELGEDLRRWLAGRPIFARPISLPARVRQWTRRNPALATVSLLLVTAVAAGALLQVRTNRRLRQALGDSRGALQQSLAAQAALKRASGTVGQRFTTLDLVQQAASLGTGFGHPELKLALRTEMAGALALPDMRPAARWPVYVGHFEGAAQFNRDLSQYACALKEGGVGVYATAEQRLVWSRRGRPEDPALTFKFSPDGRWLAAGFQDGHVEVHPLDAQTPPQIFPGQPLIRTSVEFLPDNRRVVVTDSSHGVFLMDLLSGARRTLVAPPAIGFALGLDPLGQRLSLQVGEAVRVIRLADGATVWELPLAHGARWTEWSPDGRWLAIAGGEPLFEIMILDAATAKPIYTFHDHDVAVGRVTFHPDGHSVVSTSWDGRLVWRELAPDGFRFSTEGGPRLLQLAPDGAKLAFEPAHGEVGFYELAQPSVMKKWQRLTPSDEEVFTIRLSPDGRWVATSSARAVHLWDVSAGKELAVIALPAQMWFVTILFHPDGKSLVYSGVGIGINQVELIPDELNHSAAAPLHLGATRKLGADNNLMALEFAADGRSLIVGANKQTVKNERRSPDIWLWPEAKPERARKLAADWPLVGYHLSRDSRWGLTADTTEPDITVWDPATGKHLRGLGFADPVNFELTPNGRWLLASTREGYQLVELGTWKRGAHWPAQFGQQHYRCQAFSTDSSLVATAAPNGRIDLRTLPEALELIHLPSPKTTQIKALQFSLDDARLFALTGTGDVQEWNLRELRRALARAGLDWSPAPAAR